MNRFASTGETDDPCGVPRSRSSRVPSGCCSGAASHRLTYSTTHGRSVCASTALMIRSHRTLSKNFSTSRSITQSFFQHRCPACRHRVQLALPGPVPVGVRVEHRLHRLLQPGRDHRLRDPVRDARHPEHAGPAAMRFRYFHRFHRGREIGARRHPVPDLIQVVLQILLEFRQRHPVHPRRALIGLHLLPGLLHLPLRDIERLSRRLQLAHAAPPGIPRLTKRTSHR